MDISVEEYKKYICDSKECKCEFDCSACAGGAQHCPDEKMNPQVDHPQHYNQHGMEVIDIIAAFVPDWGLNDNRAVEFAHGNAIKYILRAGHKGKPAEDLKKAKWYIDYMIREIESQKN